MYGIKLLGTGAYAPDFVLTNDMLAEMVETNDEWISTRTGIKRRHIAEGEPTWQMGLKAAERAIAAAGIDPSEIGLIINTSITSDFHTPSLACIIQGVIGADGAIAMDVNAACSGFVYAVDMAKRYMQTDSGIKKALVIANETLSRVTDYEDRSTCILFGDGAAAAVIEGCEDTLYASFIGADGSGAKFLCSRHTAAQTPFSKGKEYVFDDPIPPSRKHYLYQDGKEVYKFATKALPNAAKNACDRAGIAVEDIAMFIPHQANYRIIETAAKNLGVSMDKFYLNLQEYGNTSSASIPIALNEAIEAGRISRGDKICLVGFGAGLTYGAVVMEY